MSATSENRERTQSQPPSFTTIQASVPAFTTQAPAQQRERLVFTGPTHRSKRGANTATAHRMTERGVIQLPQQGKHQGQRPNTLIPVRIQRTRLKLLDPERVRNLSGPAVHHPTAGNARENIQLHGTKATKPSPFHNRRREPLDASTKQSRSAPLINRKMAISRPREGKIDDKTISTATNSREDTESRLLTKQLDHLVLTKQDPGTSRVQQKHSSLTNPSSMHNQSAENSDVTHFKHLSQMDGSCLEEPQDQSKLQRNDLLFHSVSLERDKRAESPNSQDTENVTSNNSSKVKDSATMQLSGNDKVQDADVTRNSSPKCHSVRRMKTEGHLTETATEIDLHCDVTEITNNTLHSLEKNNQRSTQTGLGAETHLFNKFEEDQTNSLLMNVLTSSQTKDEINKDNTAEVFPNPMPNTSYTVTQTPMVNTDTEAFTCPVVKHKGHWSDDAIIRRSQGILVLGKSTDEHEIFIPKLKFDFTPDNSIDCTSFPPLRLDCYNEGPKRRDSHNITLFTPRGPSFSKKVLRKSTTFPGLCTSVGSLSEHSSCSSRDGNVNNEHPNMKEANYPLCGIVDLSLSFRDPFIHEAIPSDIPKILFSDEENSDG
ncbi:uncharacterized protein WCC33_014727 [Rhinophrynus dorsalis]